MHNVWKIYVSKLYTKNQMSYNLTFYVYLDVKNGLLLCLHVLDYICKKSRKWSI